MFKIKLLKASKLLYDRYSSIYCRIYFIWKKISEYHEALFAKQIISNGMVVVDIGSNIGFYTKLFSKLVGNNGHVYSFEPSPKNFELLIQNTKMLKNVSLYNQGVGNYSGNADLYFSDLTNVDHKTFKTDESREKIEISMTSIDDFVLKNKLSYVNLIKIDVQGFELKVLEGSLKTIKDLSPIFILEFWPWGLLQGDTKPKNVIQFLETHFKNVNCIRGSYSEIKSKLDSDNWGRLEYFDLIATN